MDQSMLTYPWFVRVQAKNFQSFAFPGTNYHPYTLGSFSIRQLVEANMDDGRGDLYMAVREVWSDTPHAELNRKQPCIP